VEVSPAAEAGLTPAAAQYINASARKLRLLMDRTLIAELPLTSAE
jgi:hypothetical protein